MFLFFANLIDLQIICKVLFQKMKTKFKSVIFTNIFRNSFPVSQFYKFSLMELMQANIENFRGNSCVFFVNLH